MKKTCPLLTIASSTLKRHTGTNCLEEKCAWWSGMDKMCAIVATAMPVDEILPIIAKKELAS
jgi:hypothetical protein